ncbi:thioester-forming surface-anchored protein, partial [Lactobacillus gallinarum]|uniref:thioester-forming surface-anchored protein n=1 Tax=Lactobacillus gallinarum TaxID=52242 RepID=UPI0024B99338
MQTRKNAVLLAFMMILTSLLLLVSLSANITHAAEKGSTLNGQTQQFNKGEGTPNSKDSKSDSEKATPSKGTNSEDNSTTQSNQTATVTINKIASDTQKQLAGAHLQILDKNGKVVQDFTTNGEASVFNLPKGEYTLKEVSAPEGYDVAEAQPFTVADENIATTIGTTVGAGTGKTGNKIYIDSGKEEIYIYGQNGRKDLGYCFNAQKHYPDRDDPDDDKGVSYDKRSITDGSPVNQFMGTPRESKDEDSLKAIKTIIWNGFASNPDNVQKKYGLTDDELYRITQRAIWYYTDSGILDLGMPNDNLDRNVSDEVLQNALNDIIKVDPNSPIPSGMAIDFFTPDNTDYQNVLAASFTSTSTKPGKPVPVTLVDPKHEDTKPNKPVDTKPNKPVDTKPNKPVDTKPNKPVDTKPNKPVDTKPNKPVDTKPNKPVDTKPNKPVDTKPNKPVDTKPNKPVDTKPNKPVDTKPNKPVDTKPNKPVDTKPNKPVDT